jgi:hypothetical protein
MNEKLWCSVCGKWGDHKSGSYQHHPEFYQEDINTMKLSFRIKEKSTKKITEDFDTMMDKSGLDSRMGFEDVGIQSDGTPVIFDK